jgi:hypothetical protein
MKSANDLLMVIEAQQQPDMDGIYEFDREH